MTDRPSGSIACLALIKTAERNMHQFTEKSKIILKSSFMDDIIHSVESVVKAEHRYNAENRRFQRQKLDYINYKRK